MACSIHLKFAIFPGLAGLQVVADEVEFIAVATETGIGIPIVARYALHLGLGHGAVVVILAVAAPTTTGFFLVNLHGLAQRDPIDLVGCGFVAGVFWAKHPVVDHDLGVLFVLSCGDKFLFDRQAHEALGHHHEFVHAVLL